MADVRIEIEAGDAAVREKGAVLELMSLLAWDGAALKQAGELGAKPDGWGCELVFCVVVSNGTRLGVSNGPHPPRWAARKCAVHPRAS